MWGWCLFAGLVFVCFVVASWLLACSVSGLDLCIQYCGFAGLFSSAVIVVLWVLWGARLVVCLAGALCCV